MTALATIDLQPSRPPRGHFLTPTEQERIWGQIEIPNDPDACWPWTGGVNNSGDPIIALRGATRAVAHVVWEDTGREAIPRCKRLKRSCQNQRCVNPAHRGRQGAAGRDVYSADITRRRAPHATVVPAAIATLPAPAELAAPGESIEIAVGAETSVAEAPELAPRATGAITTEALTALFDKPGMHVLVIDNTGSQKSIYHAPDPECTGYGADWRGALENARTKYAAKAARRLAGAA